MKPFTWYRIENEFYNSMSGHNRIIKKITVIANSLVEAKSIAENTEYKITGNQEVTESNRISIRYILQMEHDSLIEIGSIPDWNREICGPDCLH